MTSEDTAKQSEGKVIDRAPSEEFLSSFAEIMDEAQDSIYALDTSGRFVYLNERGMESLGYSDESDILGKDFRDIISPESLEKTVNNFLARLKGKKIPPYDINIVRADGDMITVEINSTPMIEEEEVVGEWGIARDVTERKKSEGEIRKRSEILEQEIEAKNKEAQVYKRNIEIFMKNSNDAIVIVDPEMNITSWNRGAEEIYGYDAEEVIGKNISVIIPTDLRIEFEEVMNEVERRGYIRNFETERVRKDGTRINTQSTINVIRNDEGQLLGFAGIIRDITEGKQMQQELIKSKLELEQAYEKLKQHNIMLEDNVKLLEDTLKIRPVREMAVGDGEEPEITLDPRRCYLIKDGDPSTSLKIFSDLVLKKGIHGLLVTRTLPRRIREQYKIQKTPIVWLTTNQLEGETCISPSGIAELSGVIVSFLDQTENGVILIEGIEYLISQNNFRSILNLIQLINDKIMMSDSRLIIALDPRTMDEKEVHLLQKEASELLDTGHGNIDFSKRYTHLLERFRFEPERGKRQ